MRLVTHVICGNTEYPGFPADPTMDSDDAASSTTHPKRVVLAWSSGKDSAWALHRLRQDPTVEVVALLTTISEMDNRVAVHDIRAEIVQAQAVAAGLPLWSVPLPWPCSNERYAARLAPALQRSRDAGVTHWAFGDLFLEDIRSYRENLLVDTGVAPMFPLWCEPSTTLDLASAMIDAGLKAVIACVDVARVPPAIAGVQFDQALLEMLPDAVDPCGEYGEFHTFCTAGPMFEYDVGVAVGDSVVANGYCKTDISLR